jgi:hypothetical protein
MTKALSPLAAELASARASLAFFKEQVKQLTAQVKHERFALKNDKLVKAEARRAAAIEKAEARLAKLLAKQAQPVGAKALKANRKPSKVVTYGADDNAIAAAIMAKKASA